MPKNDPVLQIPAWDSPFDGEPTTFKLEFDTPLEKDKGEYMLYTYKVKAGQNCFNEDGEIMKPGTKMVLFGSDGLKNAIDGTSAGKGDTVQVVRVGEGKKTRWFATIPGATERPDKGPAPQPAPQSSRGAPARPPAPTGNAEQRFREALDEYLAAFDWALERANERGLDPSVDVNAMAFTAYKMARDLGADPYQVLGQHAPPPEEPQPGMFHGEKPDEAAAKAEEVRSHLEPILRKSELPEEDWFDFLNALRPDRDNDPPIWTWDEVPPEIGRKAYGIAREVLQRKTSWGDVFNFHDVQKQEDVPF